MKQAQVLLYNFTDSERQHRLCTVLRKIGVVVRQVPLAAHSEKVGYLLDKQDSCDKYSADTNNAPTFSFDDEVMVIDGLRGKKLDKLLAALKDNDLTVKYKSVATPFNRLWSLERLCETMRREHGMMDGDVR